MNDDRLSDLRVLRFAGFRRTVRSLARSTDFYRGALGFVDDGAVLRLGAECIELFEQADAVPISIAPPGLVDTGFQHIAIVTSNMTAALQRLAAFEFGAITKGGAVTLPASSGGVTAFKFRDPDGHPLELLQFPPGGGDARWQQGCETGAEPNLGIDHSAIAVADVERSIRFYEDRLGFSVAARQVNQGAEQDRLDGLDDTRVEVVALEPGVSKTPHLELLGYRAPRPQIASPGSTDSKVEDRFGDCIVWSVHAVPVGGSVWMTQDPDGHRHLLRPDPRAR
ncbi:MAG: VOC family protein [Rubrivivax sp.]